ncbi:hypothetical protein [Roseiflexus sp.]|uniref:hypothetical protein n=1 Tax=Roseiflexus sp. TaxID=2562120 RepID=UPI00398AE7C8
MNNRTNRPSALSFLISAAIMTLGIVMALIVLTGAPPDTTAQSGYPAPATTPAYPPPAAPTATDPPPATPRITPVSPTVAVTATATPAPPTNSPIVRPTLTSAPSLTRLPQATPQSARIAEVPPTTQPNVVECAPGQTIMISGVAPPHAPLLIYFGTRIVGGGSASASGDFVIPLMMGRERAGEYRVTVQVRGVGQIVRSLTCRVPPTTPTPVPRRLR